MTDLFDFTSIAPAGSSIYYSVLYCDSQTREKILALRMFYKKLEEITLKSAKPEIIPIQFNWWKEELARFRDHQASHPVLQIFQKYHLYADFIPDLLNLLNTFETNSRLAFYEKQTELEYFYLNTAGLLEKIIGKSLNIIQPDLLKQLENSGIFIAKTKHLLNLRKYIIQGKIYFSGENLLAYRLTLYDLSRLKLTENIRKLLENHIAQIKADFNINNKISKISKKNLIYNNILINIYQKLLAHLADNLDLIFTHKINLTPLQKWWIAWRTK